MREIADVARRWIQDEIDDITRRFLKDGETARQIAKRYPPASRNAILGVLKRAGALGHGRDRLPSQPRASTVRRKLNPKPAPLPALAHAVSEGPVEFVAPELVESVSTSGFGRNPGERRRGALIPIRPIGPKALPLLQLPPGSCKFPVGEPEPGADRLFCGEAAEEGSSYCSTCRGHTIDRHSRRESISDLVRIARRAS
jgi:hypothetical protein